MAPPSSGLRNGFVDIVPNLDRADQPSGVTQSTPSKLGLPSSPFSFHFSRKPTSDLELGPEAQRIMDGLREEAARIKAQLKADREQQKLDEEQVTGRKIARAKGRAGRFSAAHISEFKKMDSIENHPSAFRAQSNRTTPLSKSLKRSPSKANLDDSEPASIKQSAIPATASKIRMAVGIEPPSPVKRARQHLEDDASSSRPVSRDGSFLPRPKSAGKDSGIPRSQSSLASLMTPTKSSIARATASKTPAQGSLLKSPSKSNLGGLARSATTNNLLTADKAIQPSPARIIKSPSSRLERVKSILRGDKTAQAKKQSAIPLPSAPQAKTPGPSRLERGLSSLTAARTTPSRKLSKRVAFTPETKRAALTQNSPSPIKSGIPRSKSRQVLGEVYYPTLETVISENSADGEVLYPDLSARRLLPDPPLETLEAASAEPSVPGTFTFRSDHTIRFGSTSPSGFGSSPGQASLRQVRSSLAPAMIMPGSFPDSTMAVSSGLNKENVAPPITFPSIPHGMINKKRHRVSSDEEEAEKEADERAAKKRRHDTVPEGEALLAPRLISASDKKPSNSPKKFYGIRSAPNTPSPVKKKQVLSLSRLNMLARPKQRK